MGQRRYPQLCLKEGTGLKERVSDYQFPLVVLFTFLSLVSTVNAASYGAAITNSTDWLMDNQDPSGSWDGGLFWSTSEAVLALQGQDDVEAAEHIEKAIQWMESQEDESTEFFSRTGDTETLLELQNEDGGWGYSRYYWSNGIDTSLALEALKNTGSKEAIGGGIIYLGKLQWPDGAYGVEGRPDGLYTALASRALGRVSFRMINGTLQFDEDAYKSGFASSYFLTQNLDLLDKNTEVTWALMAFIYNGHFQERDRLVDRLVENQNSDGTWGFIKDGTGRTYPTALAVQALEEYAKADAGLRVEEITLEKDGASIPSGSSIPAGESYALSARISNPAEIDNANIIVVGKIVKDGRIAKVIPPELIEVLGTGSSTTFTAEVSTDALPTGPHRLVVEARDGEGRVLHSKEIGVNVLEGGGKK